MRRRAVLPITAMLALVLSACGSGRTPLPASALQDLGSVEAFRDTFNAEAQRHRLVVLLSPT